MTTGTTAPPGRDLRRKIHEFIGEPEAHSFGELALAAFRFQYESNEAYRRLLQGRGIDQQRAREISRWQDVPAASTVAFKSLELRSGPSRYVFRSSGTTRGPSNRGAHHLADVDLYRSALRRQFKRFVLPDVDRMRLLLLAPSWQSQPDSSLGFMLSDVVDQFGTLGSGFFVDSRGLDTDGLVRSLKAAEDSGEPVGLLGVVLAFVHLLEDLDRKELAFRLPPGSRIMDTGGFKGRSREVSRREMLALYERILSVPPGFVVNEYGMTELSSQFYDSSLLGGDPEVKLGPHWVRTVVIDPESEVEAARGRPGLLRHVDLANLDSVMAVESEDMGVAREAGFVLLGRAGGAEPRGCSIPVDELLEKRPF
jgi:hypothetical protein